MRQLLFILTLPSLLSAEIRFNRDVRDILAKNCLACHGPDEEDQKGNFHLDTFEGATKKNKDGQAGIVPGDPENSLIIQRITSDNKEEFMPPLDHGKPLKPKQIEILRQWIQEGAPYETHWAFQKPKAHTPPATDHPSAKNAIDHFISKKLEQFNLTPAPEADPKILLRRLALDLTGLPPSLEEAAAFSKDPSEENYQAAIQRYLAKPSYGEHWAAMWLDIARYADTVGYSGDEHRDIWPWRDWVIDAFNSNMPYDQFTIEQIAGDLLPNATKEQILATAFNRNTLNNNEGGTNDEEYRIIAVKDRISTTMNAWMGMTVRCAECHTHKYDPITHKEYYQFYAFFNQTEDANHSDDRPRIDLMPKGRESELIALHQQIAKLKEQRASNPGPWVDFAPTEVISEGGATVKRQDDGTYLFTGKNPEHDTYRITGTTSHDTKGLRLDLYPDRIHNGNFGRGPQGAMVLNHILVTSTDPLTGEITPQKLTAAAANASHGKAKIKNVIGEKSDLNGWNAKRSSDGYRGRRHAIFNLKNTIPKGHTLTVKLIHQSRSPQLNIGRLKLTTTQIANPVQRYQKKKLDPLARKIAKLEESLKAPVRVPIMKDRKKKRDTHIMIQGSFLQPGEKVEAGVPAAFDFWPKGAPKNRLGVAQWLMAPENPLTARVAVNRLWARLFGIGLVETEEDFGIQGVPPSHPELLDWLALKYQKNWDTKKLLTFLVSSHTYRQSAIADSLRLEKDPRNIYLSRGPRFRLKAEVVRDNALAVSGLLSDKQYGKGVYPANPIKKYVNAFTGGMTWVESKGEDRYRRALYTYLKRSAPHPLFETFDMATREVCNMRRIRTNTPLQSFMTLNEVTFIEAAQAMARKMANHSSKLEEQIAHGMQRALLRPGSQEQIKTLEELYQETLKDYSHASHSNEETKKLIGAQPIPSGNSPEQIAALTVVANIILNQDSFLTK